MTCLSFLATFIVGFACGVIALAILPDDEPPTDWTNTGY